MLEPPQMRACLSQSGTASGKSSVCQEIVNRLGKSKRRVLTICQDSFYRPLNPEENALAKEGKFNFDHPNAFDNGELLRVLQNLSNGIPDRIPCYDYCNNARYEDKFQNVEAADIIVVEGILIFYEEPMRKLFAMKLFVDADSDIRLARRVQRDTTERGRQLAQILNQYLTFVKPAFDEYVLPTKKFADVIIPNFKPASNEVAIDLVVKHIQEVLRSPRSSTHSSFDGDNVSTADSVSIKSAKNGFDDSDDEHKVPTKTSTTPH
uniref:Uridine/cytidine kinase n=1 Tax=Rhabditophanes sp. KR3021 TaxID=114890 RepID=A0AC35UEV2_9BILA